MRVPRLIIVWLPLALLLGLAGLGCSKWLPAPPSPDAAAPAPVASGLDGGPALTLTPLWSDRELRLAELPTAHVRFDVDELSYEMRFQDFPPGTTTVVLGRAISTGGDHTERLDVAEAIARLSPASALDDKAPLDPHAGFELRVPGYEPLKAAAPAVRVSREIAQIMEKAIDHSVLFPRETATDPPIAMHSILFVPKSSGETTLFGPAATMRDVDWVAVAEALPARKGGTCTVTPEEGKPGGPRIIKLSLVDEEVVVVERKTARILSRKSFPAVTDCPTFVTDAIEETSPDPAAIKRWLRDERTKP